MGHCPLVPSGRRWAQQLGAQAVERYARESTQMRTSRFLRTIVVAGTTAALTLLTIATTVMAATGGGDFPRLR
jgi:hypothetical protein